jgi:transcriptional regulator with XRE-family HTH domain
LVSTVPKKQANPIDAQVGNRVRLRRMLIGMSQERLGELLGLTFQQVQKYEKGVNRIGAGRLFEVSRILGVPIDYFYEGVNGQHPAGSHGHASGPSTPPIMEFVSSGEGLQLSLAFMRIKDPKVRRRMLDLVKSLAEESDKEN